MTPTREAVPKRHGLIPWSAIAIDCLLLTVFAVAIERTRRAGVFNTEQAVPNLQMKNQAGFRSRWREELR